MAARSRGGVRVWGAAIGRRAAVCVRAPARPLTIPTARRRRAATPRTHTRTPLRARNTTCATYLYPYIYSYSLYI